MSIQQTAASHCREIIGKCLDLSQADEARVAVELGDMAHLRFARNTTSTSGLAETSTISVRSTFGGRSGTARGSQVDAESLRALVLRSEEIARLSPEDPEYVRELGPEEHGGLPVPPEESLADRLEHMASGAGLCVGAARSAGLVSAGFVQVTDRVNGLGTSRGLYAERATRSATFSETARTPDGTGSGWSSTAAQSAGGLDFERVSTAAIEKAHASRNPQLLEGEETGDLPAILEPACVASLLSLFLRALDMRRAEEGRSAFSSAGGGTLLGEPLFPESIHVVSDPGDARVPTLPWTGAGLPHERTTWIKRGVLENLAVDRYWAEKQGYSPLGAAPNALMLGGPKSLASVIADTERAVLVTNFWYMRAVDPRALTYTGLTRDGVFLVEDGKVVRPLRNFRWNDSPLRVFKNVVDLSRPERVGGRGGRLRNYVVPAMRVKAFGFSSVSEAV